MNILIPMAGSDTAQGTGGEETQYMRNLYEIENKIAFQHIYESLSEIEGAAFIVVVRREDAVKYHFDDIVRLMIPRVRVIISDGPTQGAACSALLAIDCIDNDEPLLIASSSRIVARPWRQIIAEFQANGYDGAAVIFPSFHPRWSFVKLNEDDQVIEAAEKRPISGYATTGHFYYRHGKEFVASAERMIRKSAAVNGQYYVCPAYNEMILQQKRIGVYKVDKNAVFSLYDQRSVREFEAYLKGKCRNEDSEA